MKRHPDIDQSASIFHAVTCTLIHTYIGRYKVLQNEDYF
jgi:hypothetical protein